MGTKSNRKKARRTVLRTQPALVSKLREQLELLQLYGEHFDAGRKVAAYPLAICVRVLVHQTARSNSLLTQLGLQSTMRFVDTSLHFIPGNLLVAHPGLSVLGMTMGVGSSWVPRHAAQADQPNSPQTFKLWWDSPVLRDARGQTWSRARIVLDVANKEGGGHLDPEQPFDLKQLEEDNSMGWTHSDPIVGEDQPMLNGPLLSSVRQVAYELQVTLEKERGLLQ